MYCISISHRTADAAVRERLAFSAQTRQQLLSDIACDLHQCVLLCTCNRTELYLDGDEEYALARLSEYSGISREQLAPCLRIYSGNKAAEHLFSVAAGIDSMVIGEDEILGQTKNAYREAAEAGTVSYEFNIIFQAAIACAKRIKTDTALSKTSVSVATLAANEAAKLGSRVNVLMIGATGKIGSTVMKNLISRKNVTLTVTRRSHNSDLTTLCGQGLNVVDYSRRYEYMDRADCVISATSSPHYTVTAGELRNALVIRKDRLFIDLAVPRDIDPDIEKTDGVSLMGIDRFELLARENNLLKMDSVEAARQIIGEETDILTKELAFHDFLPLMDSVCDALSNKPPRELLYRMKSELDAKTFTAVLELLKNYGGNG